MSDDEVVASVIEGHSVELTLAADSMFGTVSMHPGCACGWRPTGRITNLIYAQRLVDEHVAEVAAAAAARATHRNIAAQGPRRPGDPP